MKHRLFWRLALISMLFGLLITFLVLTYTQKATTRVMIRDEASSLYREAVLISGDYASDYFQNSISLNDFSKQMHYLSDYLAAEIWLMDDEGAVLYSSSGSLPPEIQDFKAADFGNRYYTTGKFHNAFSQDMLSVFAPITVSYKVTGYVLLHRPVEAITADTTSYVNISFTTAVIVFAGALLLILFTILSIFRPLRRISIAARAYALGDFTQTIQVGPHSEMKELADTLNYMASELEKQEEDQRKFISNVSHDFRSPLTSIKGYVEAMLDGTIPVEFQERYLRIILFESERLTKLTQSLLELNQFGRHGIQLEKSDFDINQMIRTILMTFEGACYEKGLQGNLILTGQNLYVHADPAKIQQVLYNLIDNATKFARNNTEIRIETTIRNSKVLVSVKDEGVGIPSESIHKIWERFYKADKSRGKDKRGTGLGLSIVKEIINAHGENINCISTEGVGTEFIFTLPLSQREEDN